MAEHAADYTHGHMDVHAQQASFEGFMKMTKWGSLAVAVTVLFATMTFCTNAGVGSALVASIVVLAAGIFLLKEKPAAAH